MVEFAERYEIIGGLGDGGSGTVYRVLDQKLGRELALKLLGEHGGEILVVREAHALTALESPHILRVFNAGIYNDVPYIATDIAALGSAEDHIIEGVGMAPARAARWVRQALVGLDYCHRVGVIHRDITPANIFVQSEDHALLGDFGTATNLNADGSAPPGGNQRCRAPEGFGGMLTTRSDLFSAGVALWRLLTGTWPYDADTEDLLAEKMLTSDRPRLRDVAPHVHRSLASVVETALSPDPQKRAASAEAMAHQLSGCRTQTRAWVPTAATDGFDSRYVSTAGGGRLVVTVRSSGNSAVVETRRDGSGARVLRGCVETPMNRLPVELRRLFDHL